MKILVIGAGPLGSLIAARLFQGGQEVYLLSRGKRTEELEKYGIVLRVWSKEESETIHVPVVSALTAQDDYDLAIVVMRKNSGLKALPMLAKNKNIPVFLFLMNNAAGPRDFVSLLGKERVLMGFPGAAGYRDGHTIVHMNGEPDAHMEIIIDANTNSNAPNSEKIAGALEKGKYIDVTIEPFMDAWSKYHVALLFPSLAPAYYLCGNDRLRMANTRDALVLAWRAIGEGFSVLRKLGYPIRPKYLKRFQFVPEPLAILFLKKMQMNPRMDVAMTRHAEVIRDEIQQLNSEFAELISLAGSFTPYINFLTDQFNKKAPLLPYGSRSMHLRWSEILTPIMLIVLAAFILVSIFR